MKQKPPKKSAPKLRKKVGAKPANRRKREKATEWIPPSFDQTNPIGSSEASDDRVDWGPYQCTAFRRINLSLLEDAINTDNDSITFYFNGFTSDQCDEFVREHEKFFTLFKEVHPLDDATLEHAVSDANEFRDEDEHEDDDYNLDIVFRGASLGQFRSFLVGFNYGSGFAQQKVKRR